ncbi:hypothetical protein NHQ30_010157 [Ciborinia camelliae]|nr:hypothetical protein NHQ30_010157 [Ciborinia camelliae]
MAVTSGPPGQATAAPPSSPVLGLADSGINPQTAAAATPTSVPEPLAAYNQAIGVLDPIAPYETSARPEMNLAPTREMNQLPVERPLSAHFMISSCSERAYIPTPFNTPRTATRRESHLPEASSARGNEKPALKKVAPRLRGGGLSEKEKVYLRGGGPKKRRGGIACGARKKPKSDKYADVGQLLSDFKSPIFQEDANIKVRNIFPSFPGLANLQQAVLAHPLAKQTMVDQGEPYPFDQMTGDEVATTAADFKLDGTYGRFDSSWMAQAIEASQTRASGGYDAYLENQFAENWAEDDEEVSDEDVKDINDAKNGKGKNNN